MGELEAEIRVWGATAGEVLTACVAAAPDVSIDGGYLYLGSGNGRGLVVVHLHTRRDGVVVLVSADGAPAFQAAATWVVFHRTSCSRSIDYELVGVRRGDEELLSVSEDPDGNLEVTRAGIVVESASGESPPSKAITFDMLLEKWLPTIASDLGEAAAVLVDGGDVPPASDGVVPAKGDDIPF